MKIQNNNILTLGKEWERYLQLSRERPESFKQSKSLQIILDEVVVKKFEQENNVKIGVVYESPYNILIVDLVRENGELFTYERILQTSSGAVVIIPMYKNKFVLLDQFRHSLRDKQLSFPRGFGESGISSKENAQKELSEELDILSTDISATDYLGEVIADSGISGNTVSVFLCYITRYNTRYEYEGIHDTKLLTERELNDYFTKNKINDGYTLSAYCLYHAKKSLNDKLDLI